MEKKIWYKFKKMSCHHQLIKLLVLENVVIKYNTLMYQQYN